MYKLLLCWRYLRTRYIALASIVSVMLGVATMIVVNSVMAGFTHEMQHRIHGILSDITFESVSLDGVPDAQRHMEKIREIAGEHIAGMSPTVHVPAMVTLEVGGQNVTRPINLIGIDAETYAQVGDFSNYLQHPHNRNALSFELHEDGYDAWDHQDGNFRQTERREQLEHAGAGYRRMVQAAQAPLQAVPEAAISENPFYQRDQEQPAAQGATAADTNQSDDPTLEGDGFRRSGAIVGIGLLSYREGDGVDRFLAIPGDDIRITYPTSGESPDAGSNLFTIVDLYESKMSEYDAGLVFVPIRKLQEVRGMIDPSTQVARFTSIQIKLKPDADLKQVRDQLREHFPAEFYSINSWRDKQQSLLAAVEMEITVLNIVLFLIIAVAGFGILAIFYMIVVEKTRDIGILKSLGASARGVMGVFLSYGLCLGIVGSGVGMAGGLLFVKYINEIADVIGKITGRELFDPSMYYFHKIPTITDPHTVGWIVIGAVAIAVLASILPARRAARLHPVHALRFE